MRLLAHLALGGILASVGLASDVHELKKDTFDSFVEDNDLVLAECRRLLEAECVPVPVPR